MQDIERNSQEVSYLKEQLKQLQDKYFDIQFKLVHDKLDATNTRIDELNDKIDEAFIRLDGLERTQITCPVGDLKTNLERHEKKNEVDIDRINNIVEGLDYFQRHPSQLKVLFVGTVFAILMNISLFIYQLKDIFSK